jgi:tellurite resistance protein TehA-like permease
VGPSGFTVAGIVHLGNVVSTKIVPEGYMGNLQAGFFLKLLADLMGLWMWGLCLWFFLVSVGAHWQVARWGHPEHHIHFDMTWYSFVFPNTAMVTATQAIGKTFGARPIQIIGTVMGVLLVLVWFFVFGMMIRAFWLRRLLWPDDKAERERAESLTMERTPTARARRAQQAN